MDAFSHLFIAPSDYDASRAFYAQGLGWELEYEWGAAKGERGCKLRAPGGGASVVLAEPHDDDEDQAWRSGRNGRRPTVHIAAGAVDERFAALGKQAEVVVQPEDTHWGTRWFVVRDPDGNLLAFTGKPADA